MTDKQQGKLEFYRKTNLTLYRKTLDEVEARLSDQQSPYCVCGRLASGLHERSCKKFHDYALKETLKELDKIAKREAK